MFNRDIKDKVVFITGTGKANGIGRALVKAAIKEGAKKVYAAARSADSLQDLVSEFDGKVVPLELDITSQANIEEARAHSTDTQILINNAGYSEINGCTFNYNPEIARKQFDVNYWGTRRMMEAFAPILKSNGDGAIVNIISIAGLYPSPLYASYSASKAAQYSATLAARIELMSDKIAVFGAYPGPTETDMAKNIPMPNKATPEGVADRIFAGMKEGRPDIPTCSLSDSFAKYFTTNHDVVEILKKNFS